MWLEEKSGGVWREKGEERRNGERRTETARRRKRENRQKGKEELGRLREGKGGEGRAKD